MENVRCKTCPRPISSSSGYSGHQNCVICSRNSETKITRLEGECKSADQKNVKLEAEMTRMQQLEGQGRQLLESGVWSDVVIRVDGQDIPAHKCILSVK